MLLLLLLFCLSTVEVATDVAVAFAFAAQSVCCVLVLEYEIMSLKNDERSYLTRTFTSTRSE